jgi:hypothetical protein
VGSLNLLHKLWVGNKIFGVGVGVFMGKKKNPLYNIYGARKVANGKYISITLIKSGDEDDEDYEREYANILLKSKDNQKVIIKEKGVYIPVKFLEDFDEDEDETAKDTKKSKSTKGKAKSKNDKEKDEDDTLPF